jgi:hypothetical protein
MIRATTAVIAGLAVWTIVATALDILLRTALPGYETAEPHLDFTLRMMIARLALPGAVPSVAAGFAGAWISRGSPRVTAALAIILVAAFLPAHYHLWTRFPPWYHLTFLGSLILLTWLGARLRRLLVTGREAGQLREAGQGREAG